MRNVKNARGKTIGFRQQRIPLPRGRSSLARGLTMQQQHEVAVDMYRDLLVLSGLWADCLKDVDYEGETCILVSADGELRPIFEGDRLKTFRGEDVTITDCAAPRKQGSTGRIYVTFDDDYDCHTDSETSFFPGVCSLMWLALGRMGDEVEFQCDFCGNRTTDPDYDGSLCDCGKGWYFPL